MQKDWIDILTAMMTPTIAIVGSFIAFQQWKINQVRLRHELYDRRMAVYSKLMSYLSAIMRDASFPQEAFSYWFSASYEGFFLFDDKMHEYLESINAKSRAFRSNCRRLDTKRGKSDNKEWQELCEQNEELQSWFEEQFDTARNEFSRFLRLGN